MILRNDMERIRPCEMMALNTIAFQFAHVAGKAVGGKQLHQLLRRRRFLFASAPCRFAQKVIEQQRAVPLPLPEKRRDLDVVKPVIQVAPESTGRLLGQVGGEYDPCFQTFWAITAERKYSPSCRRRSSFTWEAIERSPISSRKSVRRLPPRSSRAVPGRPR